ncbi:hypothetical protein SAMN04487911_102224 [Arenibacter nanhaiticus]|uniref:DUF1684 domain-containing protein n=1 Tax=Arenibacter nanhaiticus TaxID=558155 RepID=A0A1M6BJ81_9FLAO|nr:DUF1684 domain-containing protein [Arenibacter nanhaiticus]SHI48781.1 hypothetical protein SAMN04487911_102224 [Arenibacter nanhaiticus]
MWRLILLFLLITVSCKEKKYHDTAVKNTVVLQTEALSDVLQFQNKLNEEFKDPETSPLPDRIRKNFESLDFFAPDTLFRVTAVFARTPEALPFFMPTSTGRKSEEVVYGTVTFMLEGRKHQLEVYQNQELKGQEGFEDYLFLPFADITNGEETYSGGRYLDMRIPKTDTVVIDFNKAYNPYCAYNSKYSCPLVPKQNRLDVAILAGVKAFKKDK